MPLTRPGPPRSLRFTMSHLRHGRRTPSPDRKGKQRAEPTPGRPASLDDAPGTSRPPLSSLLHEALNTPLPDPVSFATQSPFQRPSPITAPPKAHQPPLLRRHEPRLLSGLAGSTLPSSSLSYASALETRHNRTTSHPAQPPLGDTPAEWKRTASITSLYDGPFPDLDPATGLPLEVDEPSGSDHRSFHLQRTITGLQSAPLRSEENGVLPTLSDFTRSLPSLSLQGPRSSAEAWRSGTRRSLSSSPPQENWTTWATGWWNGDKGKVDNTLSEEDQADTVAEEREKHRRKCELAHNTAD